MTTGEPEVHGTHAYSGAAAPRHTYTPYETASHYNFSILDFEDLDLEVTIGGEWEPRENLRHFGTINGIRFYLGQSRDGVGVERLKNYEKDLQTKDGTTFASMFGDGFFPFRERPVLYVDPDFVQDENEDVLHLLGGAIDILNDALPPEFQIRLGGIHPTGVPGRNEILVDIRSPASIRATCSVTAVACARNTKWIRTTTAATVLVPNDLLDRYEHAALHYLDPVPMSILVHELLHALGIQGHVDSVEFPDSLMGTAGEFIPNPGFIISKLDREVLQIMYMSQLTRTYNDWGEWSDVAHHLMGATEDGSMRFGVALFNGLPHPWARGHLPSKVLADNPRLYGTATWNGSLLGFSGPSPIAGDAELRVRMSALSDPDSQHDLRFSDIAFVNRLYSDSPDKWFHVRDIDYKVVVAGNMFRNVRDPGYERGLVSGAFMGAEHEHMGGTVKRTDMVAAFGGSR